ncbi:cation:proton antiporter [Halomonas ventosae]|uniref:Sodium/proton antiporter (CPA1 family) n=1 Tax=Halomonas ventosae TaxID=229007 RepID=A0A4R6HJS2_9GAMM|nr:sodium:proton antiporter [Halomonas ventosae]TDO08724.1 sodium/proton antiporter (CPA1 family) [Halomonas ventosae]
MESPALLLTAIGLLSLACQWLAWRIKVPAILPLLLTGILVGPVSGLLDPDALLGNLLFPLVSLAVAVILFEGSLTLNFAELRGHGHTVRRLVTWGVLITAVVSALAARWLLELSWAMASLLGALLVVTGPTVVLPLLETLRAKPSLAQILRWEGILIDPIGAIGAVLVYEYVVIDASRNAVTHTLGLFGLTALIGFGLGSLGGYLWGCVLRHHWLPRQLHSFGTLMVMLTLYTLSNQLFHESGLLTVTVMGVWMANMPRVPTGPIIEFKETLSVLLISGLFILLAARLGVDQLALLSWPAWAYLGVLMVVARPLTVWLCTAGSGLDWREKTLLAWVSPRGIVAAAVASLFALKLEAEGIEGADMLVPVTFLVIIATVVVQGLLSRPIADALGVTTPPPRGFLILGANPVARAVGQALQEAGFVVRLCDHDWEALEAARMTGLPTYYGNPASEHAQMHLDMAGLGHFLPLSPYREQNDLAALYFARQLGHGKVFRIEVSGEQASSRERPEQLTELPCLFGEQVTWHKLASLVAQGAEVRTTRLHEAFAMDDYVATHGHRLLPLFCIDAQGRIRVASDQSPLEAQPGERLISLVYPDSPAF